MKTYTGHRWHNRYPETKDSVSVKVNDDTALGVVVPLLRSYFPIKASYDMPFDWGKGQVGFGGTNLSASILADHFDSYKPEGLEAIPPEIIKAFLDLVVSKFSYTDWEIDSEEIQEFVEEYAEAQLEMAERFETEANLSTEFSFVQLQHPSGVEGYVADFDEYRGVDS